MELSQEEFDLKFREIMDFVVEGMATNEEIDVEKFYGVTCFLENLTYFSPVLYGLIKDSEK